MGRAGDDGSNRVNTLPKERETIKTPLSRHDSPKVMKGSGVPPSSAGLDEGLVDQLV